MAKAKLQYECTKPTPVKGRIVKIGTIMSFPEGVIGDHPCWKLVEESKATQTKTASKKTQSKAAAEKADPFETDAEKADT